MKVVVVNENKTIKKIIEWLIYMLGYSLSLYLVSLLFDSFYIDYSHFGVYIFLTTVIIYLLNQVVKPTLVFLTLPATAMTLGLFYPIVNVIILKIADLILGSHFNILNIFPAFFIAIIISILNIIVEGFIIKPLIRKLKK